MPPKSSVIQLKQLPQSPNPPQRLAEAPGNGHSPPQIPLLSHLSRRLLLEMERRRKVNQGPKGARM